MLTLPTLDDLVIMTQVPESSVVSFLLAGCPRCGTTWVHTALKDHPEIYLPPQKQTYFFDVNYDKGINWYLQNFSGVTSEHKAAGEIATGYSQSAAIPLMAKHFPHVKIMLAMRNPSERAYSFFQSRSVGEGWRTLQEAVKAQPAILEQGRYIEHIEQLLQHYPKERLLLLYYDDLQKDDRAYLRTILTFLAVNPEYESPQFDRMVQVAAFPRLRRTLRRMRMGPLLDRVSRSPVGDILRKQLKSRGVRRYAPMDAETRTFLNDYFRPYNERLQEFSGRDLSGWMD